LADPLASSASINSAEPGVPNRYTGVEEAVVNDEPPRLRECSDLASESIG
jgi:hypothetical protein